MAKVIVDLSVSLDGFIAGPNNSTEQPLGKGGMRHFDWYFDGDTPGLHYEATSSRGVPVPPFKLFRSSAEVFDELVENGGSVVTGRRTYDIADAWAGTVPADRARSRRAASPESPLAAAPPSQPSPDQVGLRFP